jgi:hypothetical protein
MKYVDNCQVLLSAFTLAMALYGENLTVSEFIHIQENPEIQAIYLIRKGGVHNGQRENDCKRQEVSY